MSHIHYNLPCPEPDNMAALAPYMEGLAYQLDEDLAGLQDGLNAALNRPTAIWSRSTNVVNTGGTFIGVDFDQILFANYPDSANANPTWLPRLPSHTPGWWRIGFYGRVQQAAAIVANTVRVFSLRATDTLSGTVNLGLNLYSSPWFQAATLESNTNNESIVLEGTILLPDLPTVVGSSGSDVFLQLNFNATLGGGGNVSLLAGCVMWATFVTEGDQVEVHD